MEQHQYFPVMLCALCEKDWDGVRCLADRCYSQNKDEESPCLSFEILTRTSYDYSRFTRPLVGLLSRSEFVRFIWRVNGFCDLRSAITTGLEPKSAILAALMVAKIGISHTLLAILTFPNLKLQVDENQQLKHQTQTCFN